MIDSKRMGGYLENKRREAEVQGRKAEEVKRTICIHEVFIPVRPTVSHRNLVYF